jgi:hypothetical protein
MFRATNFAVTTLLLIAFTVFMAVVRQKKGLDNNWPVLYWLLVVVFTIVRSEETFSFEFILVGFGAALMLRFEFMNELFVKFFRLLELVAFVYVIYRGMEIIIV